ncbi:unnamed protein product [Staurois parvus]|uniref:Uncharacterized protein n=1 Tax=Staurois parvus TaxID=386267 RepID=A0ABN9AV07_9NEOB|nr:unnamed protein product [Staurois parvus]
MAEVAERKQLQLKAIHRPRLKSPPSSSVGRRLSRVQMGGVAIRECQLL